MNKTIVLGILWMMAATSVMAQRLTMDDPHYKVLSGLGNNIGLYQDPETKAWRVADGKFADIHGASCMKSLDQLAEAGVADSRTIEVSYDAPEFKRGLHTLAEIRKACEHVERLGKIKVFERWAQQAKADAPKLESGNYETKYYKNCNAAYDEIIKAGIAPTDRVPEQNLKSGLWSGTVEELHQKWCVAGMNQAKTKTAASEAPYRAVLKNDKLRMVIGSGDIRSYAVPGGENSADPKKLAAASVWFDDLSAPSNERQTCPSGGKRIFLRRYTFDAQHNLVNNTSKEYCGSPPASAYK